MLLLDYIWIQFFLVVWASPFGLILLAIRPFGFSIFTNPIFYCIAIFDSLDFIQTLIIEYAIGSLKTMKFFLFNYSLVFITCS